MTNRITEIKNTIGAGARQNKFNVYFTFPTAVDTAMTNIESKANILCKSSSMPERTLQGIDVWNQGRKYILPGDTTFSNSWDCTFYTTEEHNLRRAFLAWQKACDHAETGSHTGNPAAVQTTMRIAQLDSSDMNETVTYELHNVWPSTVGSLEMSQDSEGQVLEFNVTFTYTDWVVGFDEDNDNPQTYNSATRNDVSYNN